MKRTLMLTCVVMLCTALCVSQASGDIVGQGPFSGSSSEDFESFPNYSSGGNTDTLLIAGGNGLLSSNPVSSNQLWVIEPTGGASWGLGGYGSATANSGVKAMGFYNGGSLMDTTLTLANNATDFGFWYVTADSQGTTTMSVDLFDAQGNQLGVTQILDSGGAAYAWAGWSSATGIRSVRFSGNIAPVIDDVQFNLVPEPSSAIALTGVLGFALLRRRRR